jgi:hypothetical protein
MEFTRDMTTCQTCEGENTITNVLSQSFPKAGEHLCLSPFPFTGLPGWGFPFVIE